MNFVIKILIKQIYNYFHSVLLKERNFGIIFSGIFEISVFSYASSIIFDSNCHSA